ncbi:hypothetical protein QFC21_005342 [Naganishia friedmannii]|uniref:Uncharacterized protein n=1 Tax=Naganishia friedmannii TaxID=89922 RepID=A0ACC2V9E7_9TREE|nr:hypothetical protein QFC21_005342 [Naganishia friedmannii]
MRSSSPGLLFLASSFTPASPSLSRAARCSSTVPYEPTSSTAISLVSTTIVVITTAALNGNNDLTSVASTSATSLASDGEKPTVTISVKNADASVRDATPGIAYREIDCYNCPPGGSKCHYVTWDDSKGIKDELVNDDGVPHNQTCQDLYVGYLLPLHQSGQLSGKDSERVDAVAEYLIKRGYAGDDEWVLGGKPRKNDVPLGIGLGGVACAIAAGEGGGARKQTPVEVRRKILATWSSDWRKDELEAK